MADFEDAKRAFLVEGDPGGDDGAMFDGPTLEGLTSTMTGVTFCLPRELGIVATAALFLLTNRGESFSVGGKVSMYSTYSNANDEYAQWEWTVFGQQPVLGVC